MPLRARREPRLPLRWHGGRIVSRWTSTSSRPIVRREGRSPEGSGDMSFPWALPTNRPPLPLVGFARQFDPRSLRKRARTRINRAIGGQSPARPNSAPVYSPWRRRLAGDSPRWLREIAGETPAPRPKLTCAANWWAKPFPCSTGLRRGRTSTGSRWQVLALYVAALLVGRGAAAQTTLGALSNFDVFNDTGEESHGFEIERLARSRDGPLRRVTSTRGAGVSPVPPAEQAQAH